MPQTGLARLEALSISLLVHGGEGVRNSPSDTLSFFESLDHQIFAFPDLKHLFKYLILNTGNIQNIRLKSFLDFFWLALLNNIDSTFKQRNMENVILELLNELNEL